MLAIQISIYQARPTCMFQGRMAEGPPTGIAQNLTVNVNALSNAFAIALQQASAADSTRSSSSQPPVSSSTPTSRSGTSIQQSNSSRSILPYLKRKRSSASGGAGNGIKKPKLVQHYDRDIICVPDAYDASCISYPRGKFRAKLASSGLVGKLHLLSSMAVEEVQEEICSVFSKPMGGRKDFPFVYLQATGAGTRTLTAPSVSPSFRWTAPQVAKLGSTAQAIYVMAKDKLIEKCDSETDSDSEDDGPLKKKDLPLDKHPPKLIPNTDTYREYVDLIDLTTLPDDSDTASEIDELPPVPIDLLSTAGEPSRVDKSEQDVDIIVGKHIILQHQKKVIFGENEEDFQRVNIRRRNLFDDAVRAFAKSHFNVSKILKIRFVGEESVDDGGPRREFFRLLMKESFTISGLFVGWPSNVLPSHDVQAIAANKYYIVGKMISTCLIQGGQPPLCFARAVAEYMVHDKIKCEADIEDVDVRQALLKLQDAKSNEELRSIVNDDLAVRFECGYSKPAHRIDLSHKNEIIKALWLHYIFFSRHAEINQLRKGFRDTLQMESLVCMYPQEILGFLIATKKFDITPAFLEDFFIIKYSLQGSNSRTSEEAIILNWNDYLSDCAGNPVSVSDILQFLSGCTKIPACGFYSIPSILFTNEDCLPRASTCELSLTFSRSWGQLTYDDFKAKMDMCITESFGFGTP